MKNSRLFLSAFAIVTIVGSALAFKAPLGDGSTYCTRTANGICQNKVDYRIDANGNVQFPCPNNAQPYVINGSGVCEATASSIRFVSTSFGK